jgi:hypothetical protein
MQKRNLIWAVLSTALTVAATMVARRLAVKVWNIGTGEQPPARF